MEQKVLILGASGRFGRHSTEAFWNAGWKVRNFKRGGTVSLNEAARDVDVIVHGWNPLYTDWQTQLPRLTKRVIAAARQNNATVIIPGNVYVFGADAPECFSNITPHRAQNPLGRARIEMEQAFRDAGVRTIILRAGDFLDTEPSGNWFDKIIIAKLSKSVFTYPGHTDQPHAWAYLPDVAQAVVDLAEKRQSLQVFEDIPFPGYTLTGAQLHEALSTVLGQDVALRKMQWWPLRALAPIWPLGRHLIEMRYLWSKPHYLDGTRFNDVLPMFSETPLAEALATAISHLGLIDATSPAEVTSHRSEVPSPRAVGWCSPCDGETPAASQASQG